MQGSDLDGRDSADCGNQSDEQPTPAIRAGHCPLGDDDLLPSSLRRRPEAVRTDPCSQQFVDRLVPFPRPLLQSIEIDGRATSGNVDCRAGCER